MKSIPIKEPMTEASCPCSPWGNVYCLFQTNLRDSLDYIVARHTIAVVFVYLLVELGREEKDFPESRLMAW